MRAYLAATECSPPSSICLLSQKSHFTSFCLISEHSIVSLCSGSTETKLCPIFVVALTFRDNIRGSCLHFRDAIYFPENGIIKFTSQQRPASRPTCFGSWEHHTGNVIARRSVTDRKPDSPHCACAGRIRGMATVQLPPYTVTCNMFCIKAHIITVQSQFNSLILKGSLFKDTTWSLCLS